jgi:hypothetical protein
MLSHALCVMVESITLLMKITFDAPINDKARENFDLLCDV